MEVLEPALLTDASVELLGGKGRSLYQLGKLAPTRVPAWFAVSADVFADALARAGVAAEIDAALAILAKAGPTPQTVAACRELLVPLLARLQPTAEAAAAIGAAYLKLGGGHVAVRSSALDEDGAERSFAGCLDTFLYVRGADEVVAAVAGCWRSAFSERSLAYRAARGVLDAPIRVAVVVQRMVAGEVSGVLFSADPSTGDRGRAIVTSTWGLGEGVVSGKLACDTFVVDRGSQQVIERDVVAKTSEILHDGAAGTGTHEVDVAPERRERPSLADDQLRRLVDLGSAIEQAYGTPVDVEWTWGDDGPWVLQARPITTGQTARTTETGTRRLWDNSNIIESYSGVTTPLTYSFARRAYAIVYRQAFQLLGVPEADLAASAGVFEQMIGLLNGRVYYNLESWYRALQLLPGYKFNAEFMEQMMGVSEKGGFGKRPAPSSAARRYLVELPRLSASLAQLTWRFARAETLVAEFTDNFTEAYGDFEALDLDTLGYDQLVDQYLDAETRILQRWQAPIVNDILAMIFFGSLRKALSSWGVGDSALHNDLLCGEGGLESTEPTRELLRMMTDVRRDPALCQLLAGSDPDTIRTRVEADARFAWLKVRIDAHVDRFGDRCVDELKLEQPTLRDDPTFLYAALKGYLAAPPVTVDEMEAREKKIRAEAEAKVRATLARHPARRALIDWLLTRARTHVKNRENLRFARTRAFGLVRRLAVAMGKRLHAAGRLDRPEDVFFLEVGELVGFARGTATTADLRGLADVRRREHIGYRAAAPLPERFWTAGPVYLDAAMSSTTAASTDGPATAGTVLTGVGASPGVVRARARLVHDPRAATIAGEVLVANRTDPGWVPLFPCARAVVVERGSVLSHSAIVAREFGIPCVVGVRDALARLREGQLVEVDGGAGTVTAVED